MDNMSVLYAFDPCSWTATPGSTIFHRKNAFPPLLIQDENNILGNNEH